MSDTTLNGGSVRILWDAASTALVTITGNGNPSFTVNGSAVTFPYTLNSSTTFDTIHTGDYVVSVLHNGIEVAETPDGTKNVRLSGGGQVIFSPTVDMGGRGKNLLDSLATAFTPRPGNTVIPLGTSVTKQDTVDYTNVSYTNFLSNLAGAWAHGYLAWAQFFSGARLKVIRNAGIGGNTTTQMRARFQADVIAYAPRWCVFEPGPNDVVQNIGLATSQANITAIVSALKAAGIGVVLCTLTPSVNFNTPALKTYFYDLNAWIREFARSTPGVVLCDWTGVMQDATTGDPATGLTEDGVHPTNAGAMRMGKVLANAISPVIPATSTLLSSGGDTRNLMTNGLMMGTAGFLSNSATGTVADNWTVAGVSGVATNAVASKVARTDDVPGFWQQVVISAGNAAQVYNKNTNYGTDYTAGTDIVFAQAEVQVDTGAALTQLDLILSFTTSGKTISALYKYASDTATAYNPTPGGVLRTPAVTIPAGTQRIDAFIRFAGAGTVRVSRVEVRRASAEGY